MNRPSVREFAARCWEFRPTPTQIIALTLLVVLVGVITGWPVWVCVLPAFGGAAVITATFAALELWNEAAEPGPTDEQAGGLTTEAGEP